MEDELEQLTQELQEIGLSEKEAQVYLATLELGQETVQNISKKSGVNRATTYVILESLQKKGIVTIFEQDKKTIFIAEGPTALYNIILEQEEALQKRDLELDLMMPQLMSAYNLHPEKPKVSFFEGKEGLKKMQEEFLAMGSDTASVIYSPGAVMDLFSEDEIKEQRKKRVGKKIKTRSIYSASQSKEVDVALSEHRRVSELTYPFFSDVTVWENKVMIAALKGHVSGIIIENESISEAFKSIFELAYKGAGNQVEK
jgi:HTH-type transcriptional regulator, sugar sensing transcriptional regulator